MKYKNVVLASAALAALAFASSEAHATLLATITADYAPEDGGISFTNSYSQSETNVVFAGTSFGTLAPGQTVRVDLGDIDDIDSSGQSASFMIGMESFSGGPFFNPVDGTLNGNDNYEGPIAPGTVVGQITGAVPEPASLAVLSVSLIGLGLTRRRKA